MSNDQQRDKRIDDLIRLNNRKYKEERTGQEERQFMDRVAEKEGRYKLKEYAKHIQEVNQKRIKAVKEKDQEKEREKKRKKKEKEERKKRLEEDKQLKRKEEKEEVAKNRRRRNSLEIESINKKVEEQAAQELKRIHSTKLLLQTEKELKKAKLQDLENRRRTILARTKKVSVGSPEDSSKENMDSNSEAKRLLMEKAHEAEREVEFLNKIIKEAGGDLRLPEHKTKKLGEYFQQIKEQQSEEEDEGQDAESEEEDESSCDLDNYEQKQPPSPYPSSNSNPLQPTAMLSSSAPAVNYDRDYIARLLNTDNSGDETNDTELPDFGKDIFTLSSTELLSRNYIKL